ncbi:unnamed protein product [Alopecurus aequalis]
MAPGPSPSPDAEEIIRLVKILALIVVGVLAMFLLHVLGSLRRMSSHKLLHALVLGAYTLSYLLVSYTLGLMQQDCYQYYFVEFPVWAVCLLMLLGGTDNLMAYNLNEVDNWKSFQVKHLLNGGFVVVIVASHRRDVPKYETMLWGMLCVNALQSWVRINSMRLASKCNHLSRNVKPIVDYMKTEDKRQLASAATMKGYRYVVAGEHRMRNFGKQPMEDMKITTVEQIFECHGSLLRSDSERGDRLKDICLSMALSKMLNRRFAGFKLAEVNLPKTNEFVFNGLLKGKNKYERAFRVIEVELGFVYDLYYTRYPFLYQKVRHFALCLPVAMVTLCSWLTYELFKKHQQEKYSKTGNISQSTTLVLMAVVTILEAFQLYLHMASDWFKVALIRSYVTRPALQKRGCFSHMIIGLPLRLRALRPWENKLGQYSLLKDFDGTRRISNCIHYATLCLVDKAKKGCTRGKRVKLSIQVKKSIIDSLVISQGHLTNGARSLQNNGVHEMLSWACEAGDEMVTHTILVWHVATTICKHKLDASLPKDHKKMASLSAEESSAIDTACSLSNYCAYLIAFAPDLLPGHSFETASKLDESIDEARDLESLRGGKTIEEKCEILLSISDTNSNAVVIVGARLAKQLMEKIEDRKLRWKVLSDFWAEMLVYVAPCDDAQVQAHLEALARGGEFITHLWALLTHAGVLDRDPVGPLPVV